MKSAPQILIVDDDDQVLGFFMRTLSQNGYIVTGTTSGTEALGLVRGKAFDALVLDLSMPRPDGFEILRAAHRHVPNLKIVVVSGFVDGVLLKAAELFGASSALRKPVEPDALLGALSSVLNPSASATL